MEKAKVGVAFKTQYVTWRCNVTSRDLPAGHNEEDHGEIQ